ncbi:hypothetical protein NM208_g1817 [Fusarium decemcellulare]|uniref:Uncharacterized protein n=1 Tax=Fusarium decemcellulare TaxID=57161 RepID=A0ACC1SUR8_9HYPO|nr:hypothetical protein NM208_g1817 [Fusarium decemcellulare]
MLSIRLPKATATSRKRVLGLCKSSTSLYQRPIDGLAMSSYPIITRKEPPRRGITTYEHVPVQESQTRPRRIVIGITGATGTVYAIRILSILRQLGIETHLVISKWALATMKYETLLSEAEIRGMASRTYTAKDVSASIASGSFQHDGMIIVPCSMKTLAAIRSGFCDDLISRAADVSLKENRKLVLAVRETPLSDIHLDNMLFLRRAGAVIFPPVPAFYTRPKGIEDLIDQTAGRMLDSLGIFTEGFPRWEGFQPRSSHAHPRLGGIAEAQ